jgi:mRNA interferase MazF
MKYNQREIVLVPFPYSDLTALKKRPVIILSNNDYNENHQDVVVAAITSNEFIDDYSVILDDESLDYGILPEKSVIKLGKLFSINKSKIIKKFSIVKSEKYAEIILKISQLIKES